jgi:hypothetical protein
MEGVLFVVPMERKKMTKEQRRGKEKKAKFQIPIFEKGRVIIHENCHFLLDLDVLGSEMGNPTSNLTRRKMCFLFIESCK